MPQNPNFNRQTLTSFTKFLFYINDPNFYASKLLPSSPTFNLIVITGTFMPQNHNYTYQTLT
jgi:hypothetical protein